MKEGRYWEENKDKECRLCGKGKENWKHVWEECKQWGAEGCWEEMIGVVLGEEGEGENWLRKLEEIKEVGRKERIENE